jgi:hypothetical protein
MPRGTAASAGAIVLVAAGVLVATTQVPLLPQEGRLVPLDTWLAPRVPGLRDFYRHDVARAFQPLHLPLVFLFLAVAATAGLTFRASLGSWLARLMPPLSQRGLTRFRVALATALIAALTWMTPPEAVPRELQRSTDWLARQPVIRELAATTGAGTVLRGTALGALVAFGVGLWPRVALGAAGLSMTLLLGILLTSQSVHDWAMPTLTIWLLTLVPWRGAASDRHRGLALWIPALTLSCAFAAAAFAKISSSGLAWIANGSVRYHFIEDARQAPVSWGILLTSDDRTAIVFSLGAVAIEAGLWLVLLVRGPVGRALFGVAALAMFVGFYLFQGVFWPAWWTLLLAFLPWNVLERGEPERAGISLPPATRAAVVMVVLLQLAVSALRVESEPFFSDYSMYAYTWPSKEAFLDHLRGKTRQYVFSASGLADDELDAWLRGVPRGWDTLRAATESALVDQQWSDDVRGGVAALRTAYRARFHQELTSVRVSTAESDFDWTRGEFVATPRTRDLGVLDLDAGRIDGVRH